MAEEMYGERPKTETPVDMSLLKVKATVTIVSTNADLLRYELGKISMRLKELIVSGEISEATFQIKGE